MKPTLFTLVAAMIAVFAAAQVAVADPLPAPSFWTSQRGSELSISAVDSAGHIQGAYTDRTAGSQCQGLPYRIRGNATAIGLYFLVVSTQCNSLTYWAGSILGKQMTTRWRQQNLKPSPGQPMWLTGTDVFYRVN
jgi:hypothetical protein